MILEIQQINFLLLLGTIFIVGFFPLVIYLTIKFREKVHNLNKKHSELAIKWYEVSQLNDELIELAKSKGITLPMAPKDPPYKDLLK